MKWWPTFLFPPVVFVHGYYIIMTGSLVQSTVQGNNNTAITVHCAYFHQFPTSQSLVNVGEQSLRFLRVLLPIGMQETAILEIHHCSAFQNYQLLHQEVHFS